MSLRLEFVELAQREGANMALLCRRFGISRKSGYKWLGRYRRGGEAALADQSRRPQRSPERTSAELEQKIVTLRQQYRVWGGRKLAARLEALDYPQVPAPSTITAILRRHNLLDPQRSAANTAPQRFVHEQPNDLWQMDFKGHVPMSEGGRCHPLTVLDDHSRYSILLQACDNERSETVREHLTGVFRHYGLPRRMLMDNGSPWGAAGQSSEAWTGLELWLMRLGISVHHGRPMHPQTQGKEERFHQTLKAELLRWECLVNLIQAQQLFDAWRQVYNHERPHEGLELTVPGARYQPSPRGYPEQLPTVEYADGEQVRKVKANRSISFQGVHYQIGRAFRGERVALRATCRDGLWDVYYCQQRIGQLDQKAQGGRVLRSSRPLAALANDCSEG